jgi:hypothetical protein
MPATHDLWGWHIEFDLFQLAPNFFCDHPRHRVGIPTLYASAENASRRTDQNSTAHRIKSLRETSGRLRVARRRQMKPRDDGLEERSETGADFKAMQIQSNFFGVHEQNRMPWNPRVN